MIKLSDIAEAVNGNLTGDGNIQVRGIAPIETASEGEIAFLTHKSHAKHLAGCRASAVVIGKGGPPEGIASQNLITVERPDLAYIRVAQMFAPLLPATPGIDQLAFVSDGADVASTASIGPFACIEAGAVIGEHVRVYPFVYVGRNTTIGEGSILYPHVTIYSDTKIGRNVIIHGNTVIGADGFGYTWDGEKHAKIPQIGRVVIEDDVEIGANSAVDRASLGTTVIGRGTKIDNLVQVAHNVAIGEHSIVVSQVGIAGSARIGSNVVLAGQAGVRDHAVIGDRVMAGGQTGITGDVPAGSLIWGTPHMPHKEWMRLQVYLKKLPALFDKVRRMEEKLPPEDK